MYKKFVFCLVVLILFFAGCAQKQPSEQKKAIITPRGNAQIENYAIVKTFFATDRNLTGKKKPDQFFGVDRSVIRYGVCEVSIPRNHQIGFLEAPSLWKLEFREDPKKHVVLLTTAVKPKDIFFADISNFSKKTKTDSALLFVHGYNVTFENAARRTAQISYDIGFEGIPVFYSWPSQGEIGAYTIDEQNIEWTRSNLSAFIEDFLQRSNVQNIYLIAHSMGNRALTHALVAVMKDKPELRRRIKEVILTAPDIDADVFRRDIAPALTNAGRPITLYASSDDLALMASKKVHGYSRAGDAGKGLIIMPGIETIDATGMDTSLLKHSYFAETRPVISDIYYLIRKGLRADQRALLRGKNTQNGRHWEFITQY